MGDVVNMRLARIERDQRDLVNAAMGMCVAGNDSKAARMLARAVALDIERALVESTHAQDR